MPLLLPEPSRSRDERGVYSIPPPLPDNTGAAAHRLVLRDGSVATLTQATPADRAAVRRFFHELSPTSRHHRFLTAAEPTDALISRLCDDSRPTEGLTLIAWRHLGDETRPIAVASYSAAGDGIAEVAFAVHDEFQGRGIATSMLERLAAAATVHGFERFQAVTSTDNEAMLEVFRDSGFEMRSKSAQGVVDIRLDLTGSQGAARAIEKRHAAATVASLKPILTPTSVAVIGVSRDPAGLGRRIFDNLVKNEFHGRLYPVNAIVHDIGTFRCLPSARLLPEPVDLAVVVVPAAHVDEVVDDCAAAGVKSLVVITAGFAEAGVEGQRRQAALVATTRAHGMRLIGPNCMGVLNTHPDVRLNASFADRLPPRGRLALASQSGGLGLAILQLAAERHIGLSTFVSLGNKADVSGNDLLQYGEHDQETSVLLLYLESFGNPRRFGQLARAIGRSKPIVAVKSGRTGAGSRAAGSHTAGLASSETAVEALFQQSGIIRADTIGEMFDIGTCLDLQPLPPGSRVAIVSNAGGPGILAADACEAAGLQVVPLSETTRGGLGAAVPSGASLTNPVDLVASAGPDAFRQSVTRLLAAPEVDALVVIHTPIDPAGSEAVVQGIAAGVAAARHAGSSNKPVLACLMAQTVPSTPIRAGDEQIPVYPFPEQAARALAKAARYAHWRTTSPGHFWSFDEIHADEARGLCRDVVAARGRTWLSAEELRRVLYAFGLPLAAGSVARSEDEAAAIASILGFPVVLKLSAPPLLHKTDANVVRLHLTTEKAVRAAWHEIVRNAAAALEAEGRTLAPGSLGILIQPMFSGVETIIGLTEDPTFGPLVAFGLGGVSVEVLQDVAFRMAPLTDKDADGLLGEVRGAPLLRGFRGRPAVDFQALRDVLLRVSLMGVLVPEIRELDLNPVIALPDGHGCRIVDARARVG